MDNDFFIYKGHDLRHCSVLDICDDQKYIDEEIFSSFRNTKEDYISSTAEIVRITDMIDYAEHIQEIELVQKLETIYKEELASFFNE